MPSQRRCRIASLALGLVLYTLAGLLRVNAQDVTTAVDSWLMTWSFNDTTNWTSDYG